MPNEKDCIFLFLHDNDLISIEKKNATFSYRLFIKFIPDLIFYESLAVALMRKNAFFFLNL